MSESSSGIDLSSSRFFDAGIWAVSDAPPTERAERLPIDSSPILPGEEGPEMKLYRLLNPQPTFNELILEELKPYLVNRAVIIPQKFDALFEDTKNELETDSSQMSEKERLLLARTGDILSDDIGLRELLRMGIRALIAGI